MTNLELRAQIRTAIDELPENLLPEVLDHIKTLAQKGIDKERFKKIIDKIIEEDAGLLSRLAE